MAAGIIYEGKDVAEAFSLLAFLGGLFLFTPRKGEVDEDAGGMRANFFGTRRYLCLFL
ncbi:hypothetical protein [uncultured Cardiobacterium sp.]|uniref:hypothetical protein n=1 Tax=uncultured Cardiobacterium sp. TaxID=417619 RepID=UPI0026113D93|nr:hypothetical protein [uncultured Cardiobacterium sp.]